MIKYLYPDGTCCYRALHSTHAIFTGEDGKLIARAQKPSGEFYEFEIVGFEILEPGTVYS